MFVELNHIDGYPVLINVQRVMWIAPTPDNQSILYMNVADNDGVPAEVVAQESYAKLKLMFINLEEDYEKDE